MDKASSSAGARFNAVMQWFLQYTCIWKEKSEKNDNQACRSMRLQYVK